MFIPSPEKVFSETLVQPNAKATTTNIRIGKNFFHKKPPSNLIILFFFAFPIYKNLWGGV